MMTLNKIKKIIDKVEGTGAYVVNKPLAFRRISNFVNSFDWSSVFVGYQHCRIVFKANGLYYLIPVVEANTQPSGTVNQDWDFVDGKYYAYMKPKDMMAFDIYSVSGIGVVKLLVKVAGGVV